MICPRGKATEKFGKKDWEHHTLGCPARNGPCEAALTTTDYKNYVGSVRE